MTEINQFHLAFDIATLLICASNLIFTKIQGRTDKKQSIAFVLMLVIVAFNSMCDAIGVVTIPWVTTNYPHYILHDTATLLYFITHTALAPLFYYYVANVCSISITTNKIRRWSLIFLFLFAEILALTNPVFNFVYSFDSRFVFHRHWGEYVIYLSAAVFMILALAFLMHSWQVLFFKYRKALIVFSVLTLTGILIQLVSHDLKTELIAEALGLTGLMLCVEDDDFWLDSDTGFYNRKAFIIDMGVFLNNRRNMKLVCLRITNPEVVARVTGSEYATTISLTIEGFLKKVVHRTQVYHISPGTFVIVLPDVGGEKAKRLANDLVTRFDRPWRVKDSLLLLNAVIMITELPGTISSAQDAVYMFESPIPTDNDKKILMAEDMSYLVRRTEVAKAINRGLAEKSFEVYYQPTYNLMDRKLHGAEALIRMHDKLLGNVYPDEFIPIAERNGMIDDIDDFVLFEVCRFIQSGKPKELGLGSINVNLSVMQCIKPGFVEHIIGIVEEAGVDKSFINFEITESWASDDYKILSDVIKALKSEGFMFSMDDYGTGYSNMSALFSLDLDVIKIDKSILWEAQKSEMGKIILENSIRMIKQMKRGILVEGVETEEQIKLLEPLGVDYLQGFYFSKPVPEGEFIKVASRNKETEGDKK
ncbi:MAG: EAL domain-containing protein [Clostridiales bacterium]|nr:EAL domain-containing protein [Clostridiales bacterium]